MVSFECFLSANPLTFASVDQRKFMKIRRFYENRSFQEAKDNQHLF